MNEREKNFLEHFLSTVGNIHIWGFFLVLMVVGTLSVLLPKPTVSEIEKRQLAEMPVFSLQQFFSGEYAKEMSAYYSDTFPFRDKLVFLSSRFQESFGLPYDGIRLKPGESFGMPALPVEPEKPMEPPMPPLPPMTESSSEDAEESSTAPNPVEQPADPSDITPAPTDPNEGFTNSGIFIYKNRAFQLYFGGPKTGYAYSQAIAAISAQLPSVQIYSLVVPSPIEFVLPPKYRSVSAEEKPQIDTMVQNIQALSEGRVKTVNAYDKISEHRDEYLYFSTDHHWTTLGAYYAYTGFCEAAGLEPVSLDSLEKRTIPNFLGTLYARTQDSTLASNPDHVDYYIMPTEYEMAHYTNGGNGAPVAGSLYAENAGGGNSYSVFLGGDIPLSVIDTQVENGKTICVVKESYGNAFVPWLVNHYQRVVVIDPRHCTRNFGDIIETFGVNEILFINNIFAAHTPGNKDLIWGLSSQLQSYEDGSWLIPPSEEVPPEEVPSEEHPVAGDQQPEENQGADEVVMEPDEDNEP